MDAGKNMVKEKTHGLNYMQHMLKTSEHCFVTILSMSTIEEAHVQKVSPLKKPSIEHILMC